MNDNEKILTSILQTVQMGQSGIECVENKAIQPELKQLLREQMQDYQHMESQAHALSERLNYRLQSINPMVQKMSSLTAKCRLMAGDTDSTIAAMLVQGNTKGMIMGLKELHKAQQVDEAVDQLANKLLDMENINIQNARAFL